MDRPSTYEVAGGEAAFLALATAHHERCLEVLGGPPTFSTSCSDHSGMLGIHANQGADSDLGDRFVACFVAAIEDAGLPDDAGLRATLRACMEWAVDEVMSYSPHEATVPADLAMPRWSWDGAVSG